MLGTAGGWLMVATDYDEEDYGEPWDEDTDVMPDDDGEYEDDCE